MLWVFEVFGKVVAKGLDHERSGFRHRQVFDEAVILDLWGKTIDGAIHPCGFLLNAANVLDLLQVVVAEILPTHSLISSHSLASTAGLMAMQ